MSRYGGPTYYRADAQGCMSVTCWCERAIIPVPIDEIARGLTRSCGRRDCK